MIKTAILVDGGFYRRRSSLLWGKKTPEGRADELAAYCKAHINNTNDKRYERTLYRIFYYDCPPLKKQVYHPLKGNINFGKSETYQWTLDFFDALKQKRKFALRLGILSDDFAEFRLKQGVIRKLCSKKLTVDDLTEDSFEISFSQKGVDMKLGLDIASLAYKRQVDQIVLISGDSDFVPAAKHARREGIDFILDPMWGTVKPELYEHIDGLQSQWGKKPTSNQQINK